MKNRSRFRVRRTSVVPSKLMFVLSGTIEEGQIGPGMTARAEGTDFQQAVDAVEYVLISASEGVEEPALTFRFADEAELHRWEEIEWVGRVLDLS